MKFEYQISVDDYVAAQVLYYKLRNRRKQIKHAAFGIGISILFIFIAWNEEVPGLAPALLAGTGVFWICASIRSLFPGSYIRRHYGGTGLSGKKYQASVDEEGLEVIGDFCSWRVRWAGVSVKGEGKDVFILFGANTLFMFGKKYLTDDEQHELRRLATLATPQPS